MDEKVDNNEIDSMPTNDNTEVVDDTLKPVESSDTNEKIEDTNQDVVENGTKEEKIISEEESVKEETTQVINNTQAENIVTSVPNISNTQVINPVLSWQNKDNDKLSKKKIILYSIIGGVVLLIIIFLKKNYHHNLALFNTGYIFLKIFSISFNFFAPDITIFPVSKKVAFIFCSLKLIYKITIG